MTELKFSPPLDNDSKPPSKVGRYKVVHEVGRGGMAYIYKAYDENLDKTVAIKFLKPELISGDQYLERFQREARIAASLEHPNIVNVFDFGYEQGWYYFVMSYIEGVSAFKLIRLFGSIPLPDAIRIALDILAALSYAHQQDVIHRDLKPENFMISKDGLVFLADFGIARPIFGSVLTRVSQRVGTPVYMAPEQVRGIPLDARSDIYAIGIALFEMLTGQLPFDGEDEIEIGHHHLTTPAPAPSLINSDITPAIDLVILKALSKEKVDRFQSAREMIDSLQEAVIADSIILPQTANPNTMESRVSNLNPMTLAECLLEMKLKQTMTSPNVSNLQSDLFYYYAPRLVFLGFVLAVAGFMYYLITTGLSQATSVLSK